MLKHHMIFKACVNRYFWWGKLLGAALGFLMAGPIGALLGLFAGNLFDRGLHGHLAKAHNFYRTEKRPAVKKAFLRAVFSSMGHMAKADGRVSQEEIQMAQTIMRELRLTQSEQTAAKRFFQQGKQTTHRVAEPLNLLKSIVQDNTNLLHSFIQLQYRMAQVDGLTPEKVTTLNVLLNELGLAPLHQQAHARDAYTTQFNQHRSWGQYYSRDEHTKKTNEEYYTSPKFYTSDTLNAAYEKLGLSPNATQQEVKRAYRRLISKHHPDKYIAEGKSEQQIKAANEKTQAIRKAYEQICKAHIS